MLGTITDLYLTYTFLRRLTSSFESWKAFKLGVIDKEGNILIKKQDRDAWQKESLSNLDIMILNLRKILQKIPGGNSMFARYSAALFLLKENNIDTIESDFLKYLQENEGIPTNNVGSGNIAGVNGEVYSPVGKKKILKRKKIEEKLDQTDIAILKAKVNRIYSNSIIQPKFTNHFLDRVNDDRNKPDITLKELIDFYNNHYIKSSKKIAKETDIEAVLKELNSDINIPVYIEKMPNGKIELRAKTIMRKKNFSPKGKVFVV